MRFGEFLGYPHYGLGFQSGQVGQYLPQVLVVRTAELDLDEATAAVIAVCGREIGGIPLYRDLGVLKFQGDSYGIGQAIQVVG